MLGQLLNPVNLFIFAVMLGILVFVHELGHFFVAKRLGVPVFEFGFGFPPRAWRFWKSEGRIELQGRRIVIPRDFKLPEKLQIGSRVTYKTQRDAQSREILSGIELVDAESQGSTPSSPVTSLDPGTEYTVNWIPLGGFVRLVGEDNPDVPGGFQSAKPSVRAPILLAGVTMNFILAYLIFSLLSVITPPYAAIQTTRISAVAPDSPAANAGILKGDSVASVNGQNVLNDFPALSKALRDNLGRSVTLIVVRNGKMLEPTTVVPRVTPPKGEGPLGVGLDGMIGVRVLSIEPGSVADRAGVRAGDVVAFLHDPKSPRGATQDELAQYARTHPSFKIEWHIAREGKLIQPDPTVVQIPETVTAQNATLGLETQIPVWQAPVEGARTLGRIIASVPLMFEQIARAGLPDNSFVGIVGIAQATGEIAQRGGVLDLIGWLGLLSLNLAIVNLFPFPPLDGGHLVFVFLEWVRGGKRVDLKKQTLISQIGIVVLLGLMVVVTFSDIQRVIAGRSILP